MTDPHDIAIREARNADADGLIKLIGDIFSDFEGCVLDLTGIDHELLAIDTAIKKLHGKFWVAEREGRIIGSIGYAPKEENVIELKRLYVAKDVRRCGLGARLYEIVLDAAKRHKAEAIDLWSDTRFADAHAFYLAKGFEKLPKTRKLHDPSNSTEYHFIKYL